ncbi:MAG: hypothetical protein ACYS0G_09230 [Planctomycetota bacterium]|jgi:hypothetical protein
MRGLFGACTAAYWLGLALWLAALVSGAVAAANVFGTLGDMPMHLEQYAAYPADEHGMLAAGQVMDGVFFAADLLQFFAIPLTVLTLIAHLAIYRLPVTSKANLVRTVCVLAGAALFAYHATMLAPNMNRELRQRWEAAEVGDVAGARAHQRAFNELHPRAEMVLRINLILVVVAVGASAIALGPGGRKDPPSVLAEPELLSNR